MKLNELTLKATVEGIKKGEFKALDVAKATLDEIDEREGEIGAYLSVNKEDVLASAQAVDNAIASGGKVGDLAGAPIALKDVILYKGYPATAGSKILKEYKASYDSTVSRKLREAGMVMVGKTNMDEFAMGSSTENSGFGGSSRQPAAFCGIVGLKTTYGAVSRYGLIAMASSLDQIGPMTKTVEDAAMVFKVIAGQDPLDSTSNSKAQYGNKILNPDFESIKKLKIGIPKEYFEGGLDSDVERSMQETIGWFKKNGFSVEEVSLPNTKYALSVYYILMPAEASTNLARFDGIRYGTRLDAKDLEELYLKDRGEGFGAEVKRRITLGTFVLSAGYYEAYYGKAQRVRALIKKDFDEAFKKVDVLLTPTTPTVPFKFGEKSQNPLQMYLSDIFTIPANLAGIPALNIPVKGREGKLPVGFQITGKAFREADILGLGMLYESS
ncbi:MAG: Glutamyl-tRNA(Gln) amidotransferase subunit A [Parcubacteria group bacterium GW2011_GWA2_46_10]|nr:MAG: Glutamyl-tRNA(Gln) amidotransferase subunit A [Parcubacteria group bacterium GW2011_GWA2_46_10]